MTQTRPASLLAGNRLRQYDDRRHHSHPVTTQDAHQCRTREDTTDPTIDLADALDVLAFSRRRHAIEYIVTQDHDDSIPVGEIAEYITAEENDCPIEAVTSDERSHVYISLIQQHCTILDRTALIDYNDDRKEIEHPSILAVTNS